MDSLGIRLKDIRILNGCTEEDVAECLGITKQAVSKYEKGKSFPSTDILQKMTAFFLLPKGYLTKPDLLPQEKSEIFYRKMRRTPKKELEEAQVQLKWLYEIILALEGFANLKKPDWPVFQSAMPVEQKAAVLREHWNIRGNPIPDMKELLEAHGFYLFSEALSNSQIDGYSQYIGQYPIIVLNIVRGTKERQQFSLAHELGHLLLHRKGCGLTQDEKEKEADYFAGCFLMPEEAIKANMIRTNMDYIAYMAKEWSVSEHAVIMRCKQLSLFDTDPRENERKAAALFRKANISSHDDGQGKVCRYCSIQEKLRRIDAVKSDRERFLETLLFPVGQIQRLCALPDIFEASKQNTRLEEPESMEGVQLSFAF